MKAYFLLPLALVMASCAYYFEPEFNLSDEKRIYQVIDGDTFIITGGEYVRLVGIDAPDRGEQGYHEAADFLRQFEGKKILLEREGSDRDRFGRLRRHAYAGNMSLSLLLLQNGHAVIYRSYDGAFLEDFTSALK